MNFSKVKENEYLFEFFLENNKIALDKIIDFSLFQLIYVLNQDVLDKINIEHIDKNNINMLVILRHFMEDLGVKQKYSYVHIEKVIENNKIFFYSTTIQNRNPFINGNGNLNNIREDGLELIKMRENIGVCEILSPNKVFFSFHIYFNENMFIPSFIEKITKNILFKIFDRIKEYIEKMV